MRRQPLTERQRRSRRSAAVLVLLCTAAVAAALPGASRATAAFVGTTTQVTNKIGVQLDPSISGDIVVFTDSSGGLGDDIRYVDVSNPSADVAVTNDAGDQRMHDVSGHTIVYTDQAVPPDSVLAYDVPSATTTVVSASNDRNPRLDGQIVAFERGSSGATDIVAIDMSTDPDTEIVVASTSLFIETNPAVSGTRVVYERRTTVGGPGDIVMFDTSTMTETVISSTPSDERRPDIDGNFVVYDVEVAPGDIDIAIHDLSTSTTTVLAQAGKQRLAHVSNGVIAYDHENTTSNVDVYLRDIPSGATAVVASSGANDFLNDIDGNRVVYTSNADGDFDIYVYEFALQQADIGVAPASHDFGDVNVGSSATTTVTISNVGEQPLVVSSLAISPSGGPFGIGPAPSPPATVPPGGSIDVEVAFAPTASGDQSATLTIGSDDVDEGTVEVALSGTGVGATPAQLIVALIDKTLLFLDLPSLKPVLKARLEAAAAALIANNKPAACAGLSLYILAVKLAPASALTPAEKAELVADAKGIKAAIGCP